MIRHIFLDKTVTILKGSPVNTGLNPVAELNYGKEVTRFLVHFDANQIKNMVDDKTIADLDRVTFTLKMTNTAGIDGVPYDNKPMFGNTCLRKERASSFMVLAMKLPCSFDAGRGFEFASDVWITKNSSYSEEGCNWFQCYNGKAWDEEGVYSLETIKEEYDKFSAGEPSLVINRQHFDFGDEQLSIDITNYVEDLLDGEPNNGILICFSPAFEEMEKPMQQYVGFFTDHTNTFFHPYVEIDYNEPIKDDREAFYQGKVNRLYLYVNVNGRPENLDNMPTCVFDETECEVSQVTKGVYCAKVPPMDLMEDEIISDVWSNLSYGGEEQEDVEMEAVVLPRSGFISIGNNTRKGNTLVPAIYGINDDENVKRGDVREVVVDFRKKYTTNERETVADAWYRLYVKSGEQQIDIFNGYQPIERTFLHNYFMIYSGDLIPNNKYYVDIKVKNGREEKIYENVLHFKIADDVTERYA